MMLLVGSPNIIAFEHHEGWARDSNPNRVTLPQIKLSVRLLQTPHLPP